MHLHKYDYGLQLVDQYLAFDVFISANNQIKRHLANTQSIVAIIRHPRCALQSRPLHFEHFQYIL